MEKLHNAHYFSLSSQGNIYTITILRLANNTNKLLVASLRREIICFEYAENPLGVLVPTTKEVSFTYLPKGAEIISMDAFNKSETANDFVIGITIIKNSTDLHALETFLNIYSGWEESKDFNMEIISQNCVNNIELKYIPYHLTHTLLTTWLGDNLVSKEVVFLLSGSDCKIHMYQENKVNHTYKELEIAEYFPEFVKLPTIVVWMDVYYYSKNTKRLTAFGCECGYIRLCCVCVKTCTILFNFSTSFNNTISTVRIYPTEQKLTQPHFIKDEYKIKMEEDPTLNLIVTNTLLPPVYFCDVLQFGLERYDSLPRLDLTSVLSCTEIADVNFDGCNEILIGTSNHEVIFYELDHNQGWCISEIRNFASPIFGIKYVDITGDGVKELIVLTMKGVNILQHDNTHVHQVLTEKLKMLSIPDMQSLLIDR